MSQPTIVDIARRAGVSKSLVSLVLRDSPNVSEEKRHAVLRAVEELDYRPNLMARSLVRRRTGVLGVMLSDLHNTFFADVLDGIDERAGEGGYRTLLATGHRRARGEAEAIESLLELRTEGLILAAPRLAAKRIAEASRTVPVVVLARAVRLSSVDSVTNDERAGSALAVEHLIGLGHEWIAHIDGGSGAGAAGRRSGYQRTMERHGLGDRVRTVRGDYTEAGGAEGVRRLFERGPRPTAIFAANDLSALGALGALERLGLRVPEDVSVVGYDNTSIARLGHIDLTTIAQPRREMGRAAVDLLLERVDGDRRTPRRIVVTPSLVVGTTTGPPAERKGGH